MFRRHNLIREVDVEVVSPADEIPFVVQLLPTGELPGVEAERAPLVEVEPVAPLEKLEPPIELAGAVEAQPDERPEVAAAPAKPPRQRTKLSSSPQRVASSAPPAEETVTPEPDAGTDQDLTCEIVFWRGYREATFYARIFSDDGEPLAVAQSPAFRARGNGTPEETDEAIAAYQALREQLELTGWDRVADGDAWFGGVYGRSL
jgi:hypothetical protein